MNSLLDLPSTTLATLEEDVLIIYTYDGLPAISFQKRVTSEASRMLGRKSHHDGYQITWHPNATLSAGIDRALRLH